MLVILRQRSDHIRSDRYIFAFHEERWNGNFDRLFDALLGDKMCLFIYFSYFARIYH